MNKTFIATIILAIIIIILMIWISNPREFLSKLQQINLTYILLVLILYFVNLISKAFRWFILVRSSGSDVPFKKTFPLYVIALAFNNVTPGKIGGEPVRAYLLKKEAKVPIGQGIASILTEKIMDIIVVTIMALIGAFIIIPLLPDNEAKILIGLLILVIAGIAVTLLILSSEKILNKVVNIFVNIGMKRTDGGFMKKITTALVGFIDKFKSGMKNIFQSKKSAVGCIILTVVIWINEALRLYIILLALPDIEAVSIGAVFIASSIANIIGILLPLGAGNIIGIGAVFIAVGMDPADASAGGILHAATSIWISVPIGVAAMLLTGYKLSKMNKSVK